MVIYGLIHDLESNDGQTWPKSTSESGIYVSLLGLCNLSHAHLVIKAGSVIDLVSDGAAVNTQSCCSLIS